MCGAGVGGVCKGVGGGEGGGEKGVLLASSLKADAVKCLHRT